jgi:PIN domain nuclease of toxin-antitoxin system
LALSVEIPHALRVYQLPALHQDPFDRLLIAQAQLEKCPLITIDKEIARYDVTVLW